MSQRHAKSIITLWSGAARISFCKGKLRICEVAQCLNKRLVGGKIILSSPENSLDLNDSKITLWKTLGAAVPPPLSAAPLGLRKQFSWLSECFSYGMQLTSLLFNPLLQKWNLRLIKVFKIVMSKEARILCPYSIILYNTFGGKWYTDVLSCTPWPSRPLLVLCTPILCNILCNTL